MVVRLARVRIDSAHEPLMLWARTLREGVASTERDAGSLDSGVVADAGAHLVTPQSTQGCGCRLAAHHHKGGMGGLLMVLGLIGIRRLRRREVWTATAATRAALDKGTKTDSLELAQGVHLCATMKEHS